MPQPPQPSNPRWSKNLKPHTRMPPVPKTAPSQTRLPRPRPRRLIQRSPLASPTNLVKPPSPVRPANPPRPHRSQARLLPSRELARRSPVLRNRLPRLNQRSSHRSHSSPRSLRSHRSPRKRQLLRSPVLTSQLLPSRVRLRPSRALKLLSPVPTHRSLVLRSRLLPSQALRSQPLPNPARLVPSQDHVAGHLAAATTHLPRNIPKNVPVDPAPAGGAVGDLVPATTRSRPNRECVEPRARANAQHRGPAAVAAKRHPRQKVPAAQPRT